ncbi:DUF7502 family protein, partial [Candidatus Venteria ishoeyi]|uniref:DUF7502 family protein n=1 Tax=Candidatus Venteria ishoeyi TaxID=1899563 RepID=UPI00255C3329
MGKFNLVIKEVVSLLRGAILVNTFVNVAVVFSILFLILSLFNFFPGIIAGIISLLYFVKTLFKKNFYYTIKLIEEKFPFLKDKLGTAKDTLNEDNYIINELRTEVSKKLRKVNADSFFNLGKIYLKTFIIIIVIFAILISTTNGFI